MDLQVESREDDGTELPVLVWRFATPMRTISSSVLGGGLGTSTWVINAQVLPATPERTLTGTSPKWLQPSASTAGVSASSLPPRTSGGLDRLEIALP